MTNKLLNLNHEKAAAFIEQLQSMDENTRLLVLQCFYPINAPDKARHAQTLTKIAKNPQTKHAVDFLAQQFAMKTEKEQNLDAMVLSMKDMTVSERETLLRDIMKPLLDELTLATPMQSIMHALTNTNIEQKINYIATHLWLPKTGVHDAAVQILKLTTKDIDIPSLKTFPPTPQPRN